MYVDSMKVTKHVLAEMCYALGEYPTKAHVYWEVMESLRCGAS